jgi:probable rRNA maturation factor
MILVEVDDGGHEEVPLAEIEGGVLAACRHLGASEGELSVALLDDPEISLLNRTHLGHEGPTDVISFALYQPGEPVLGDVYLGYEQAVRQAAEEGVPLAEELVRLAIHGALHVLGLHHPETAEHREGSPMYRLQEALLEGVLGREGSPPAPRPAEDHRQP